MFGLPDAKAMSRADAVGDLLGNELIHEMIEAARTRVFDSVLVRTDIVGDIIRAALEKGAFRVL